MDVKRTFSGLDVDAGDRRRDIILILHQKKELCVRQGETGVVGLCVRCVCVSAQACDSL